ncbi:MAG: cell division protein ZapD [Burkholderiaceae bacterium]
MTLYEYPLNERIRTFLRLEKAFRRFRFFRDGDDHNHHVQALALLFDLLDLTGRNDIRSELMTELQNQSTALKTFRDSPGVSPEALERLLLEVSSAIRKLNSLGSGRPGQNIKDSEWLMSVRSRIMIAGGATDFDMPSFWAWQNLPADRRQRQLDDWHASFNELRQALQLSLRLLRESGKPEQLDATDGSCQHSLGGRTFQMARIRVDETLGVVPDISANKYLLWIRFSTFDGLSRPTPISRGVTFDLTLCNLESEPD